MPVTPDDLLEYAKDLVVDDLEVRRRNGAGRAFYAAFHLCRPLAGRIDPERKKGGRSHEWIVRVFSEFGGPSDKELAGKVRTLGRLYFQARDLRGKADYDIGLDFTAEDATLLLETAKSIKALTVKLHKVELG